MFNPLDCMFNTSRLSSVIVMSELSKSVMCQIQNRQTALTDSSMKDIVSEGEEKS